jgi:hypothetical protein
MNNLWIYGDSFSCYCDSNPCWTLNVANSLKLTLKNYAVGGASNETGIRRFVSNLTNYKPGDVIIFQTSSDSRLHLQFQINRPETAASYQSDRVDLNDIRHNWYKENSSYVKWLIANTDQHLLDINAESYVHVVKNFAEANPDITVLVLQNQPQKIQFPHSKPTNFIRSNTSLSIVSENEYASETSYFDWIKYTRGDPRNNHLSNENAIILSIIVTKMIRDKSDKDLVYDAFKQSFLPTIKTKKNLEDLIQAGILPTDPWKIGVTEIMKKSLL